MRPLLEGAVPVRGGNNVHVPYTKRGWRKWRCSICFCLVHKRDVYRHAIMHVERSEGVHLLDRWRFSARVTVHPEFTVWQGPTTDHPGPS